MRWCLGFLLMCGCSKPTATRGLVVDELEPGADAVAASDVDLYGRKVALVVGIADYADNALDLRFARKDAEAVATLLEQRYGFETRKLFDEQATLDDLESALRALTEELGEDDALLVYWGGHGTTVALPRGGELGYLLPHDGKRGADGELDNVLSMESLRETLGLRMPAKHRFLVVDACYSGLLATRDLTLPPHTATYLERVTREDAYQVLTAGRADQKVLDGGRNGHSVFANRFLRTLEHVDDYVTAEELSVEVRRGVQTDAWGIAQHHQNPDYGRILGDGDFVFLPTGPAPAAPAPTAELAQAAPRLSGLLDQLGMALLMLQGSKSSTMEKLADFRARPTEANWERVQHFAGRQLEDVLAIQAEWEATLVELGRQDRDLLRQVAWDIQRITDVMTEILGEAPDSPLRAEKSAAWLDDLRELQDGLRAHETAVLDLTNPEAPE